MFAEAVQGACNACEKIETDRLQDWNRFPNTDEPTPIAPITHADTDRHGLAGGLQGVRLADGQHPERAGAAGAGRGLAGARPKLLGKSGVFKDITGLDANQQNVIRTYLSNQENAKAFAEMAKEMAMQHHNTQNAGKIMDSIKSAQERRRASSQEDYGKLVKDHLQQQIDGGKTRQALTAGDSQLAAVTADAVRTRTPIEASQTFPDGTVATIKQGSNTAGAGSFDFTVPGMRTLKQGTPDTCWAAVVAMLQAWKSGEPGEITVEGEIAKLGVPYTQLLATNQVLTTSDKNPLLAKLGLVVDPIGLSSAMPEQYLRLMQQYGPLWATVDGNLTAATAEHAKILYGMRGDGTASGTMLRVIDPRDGKPVELNFAVYLREFEELARAGNVVALNGQIVRFARPIIGAGEGASTDTVYDLLTNIARVASMGLQANPAARLIPIPVGTEPYGFDHQHSEGWTGKTVVSSTGLECSELKFPIEHEMAGRSHTDAIQRARQPELDQRPREVRRRHVPIATHAPIPARGR